MLSPQQRRFAELFRGRTDVYGSDWGSCVKEPLTDDVWRNHLDGQTPIGVYPLITPVDSEPICWWGCVDIDFEDIELAKALRICGRQLGLDPWIERSRSKGYHVWFLADRATPARTMRAALMAVCQIIGYSPKEVNPKQVDVAHLDKGIGNYVRLPYPGGGDHAAGRQKMLHPHEQIWCALDVWLMFGPRRSTPAEFEAAAQLYVEPPKPKPVSILTPRTSDQQLTDKLSGKTWTIYRDGPLEGSDRSGTLAKLAHECRRDGLTAGEALVIVTDADARWGKYSRRADGADQLRRLIEAAYG